MKLPHRFWMRFTPRPLTIKLALFLVLLEPCFCSQQISNFGFYFGKDLVPPQANSAVYDTFKLVSLYFSTVPNGPAIVRWTGADNADEVSVTLYAIAGSGDVTFTGTPGQYPPGSAKMATIPVDGSAVQGIINYGDRFEVIAYANYKTISVSCKAGLYLPRSSLLPTPTPLPTATPTQAPQPVPQHSNSSSSQSRPKPKPTSPPPGTMPATP